MQNSQFNNAPVTLFGVHELLRRTRHSKKAKDQPLFKLADNYMNKFELLDLYEKLVPNTNFTDPNVVFSYPEAIAVVGGVIGGAIMAKAAEDGTIFDVKSGLWTAAAIELGLQISGRYAHGRDIRATAPWNSALYLDTHLALLRDHPDELYLARKETIPRSHIGLKFKSQYYPAAKQIASGQYYPGLKEFHATAARKAA